LLDFWWECFIGKYGREQVHRGLSTVCEDSTHDAAFRVAALVDKRCKVVSEERFAQHFVPVLRRFPCLMMSCIEVVFKHIKHKLQPQSPAVPAILVSHGAIECPAYYGPEVLCVCKKRVLLGVI
jgi:hypothetical protein